MRNTAERREQKGVSCWIKAKVKVCEKNTYG